MDDLLYEGWVLYVLHLLSLLLHLLILLLHGPHIDDSCLWVSRYACCVDLYWAGQLYSGWVAGYSSTAALDLQLLTSCCLDDLCCLLRLLGLLLLLLLLLYDLRLRLWLWLRLLCSGQPEILAFLLAAASVSLVKFPIEENKTALLTFKRTFPCVFGLVRLQVLRRLEGGVTLLALKWTVLSLLLPLALERWVVRVEGSVRAGTPTWLVLVACHAVTGCPSRVHWVVLYRGRLRLLYWLCLCLLRRLVRRELPFYWSWVQDWFWSVRHQRSLFHTTRLVAAEVGLIHKREVAVLAGERAIAGVFLLVFN